MHTFYLFGEKEKPVLRSQLVKTSIKGLSSSFNTVHLFGEKNMLRSQFVKTPIEGLSSNFNTFHLLFGEKSFQFVKTPIAEPAQLFWGLKQISK
jgi:hypothetical protein